MSEKETEEIELRFQAAVFSLECLKRAAYRFSHLAAFDFRIDSEEIIVRVRPLESIPPSRDIFSSQKFKRQVLDEDLRSKIAEKTEPLRNTILSHVFSKTGLVDGE